MSWRGALARGANPLEAVAVRDAMHVGLISCTGDTPLWQVGRMMSDERVHCILISPDADRSDGWRVVSDVDLACAAVDHLAPARTVAGTPLVTVSEDDSVFRATRLMCEYEAAHLLVLADDGPSGVLSTFDVAGVVARIGEPEPRKPRS